MKNFFKKVWAKIKKWWVAMLVALGLVSAPILYAEVVTFTYVAATENIDGSPLDIADIAFTRLYCNDVLVVSEAGADLDFNPELGIGSYSCYATHVVLAPDGTELESDPSNRVTRVVNPARPQPPVLN